MVNYSQSSAMSRGGFAPNVQYNTTVRMPTQPMPELKQPDSKFNIDLAGLGRGLAQAAYQERLAQKEEMKLAKEQHELMLKTEFAKEANLIQMGVDQGAYSAEAGQIKSRSLTDKYLGYGLDPDELFPIYENAVSSDVRDIYSNRRKKIEDTKNEVESTIVKDVWSKVPETTNWSFEETLNYGKKNQMISDEMSLAMEYGVGEQEAAGNFIDVQANSTVLNMKQGLINGDFSGEEAKLNLYKSTTLALAKKNPNMSASMIKDLATRRLEGTFQYIDMITKANEADRKLISDNYNTMLKKDQMYYYQYLEPEDKAKYLYGLLDKTKPEDAGIFGPRATQVGTQEVISADGKTTTSSPVYRVKDVAGNEIEVTAASSKEAIEILSNASKRVYPEGSGATPYIQQALPQAYNNTNVTVKDFQTKTPEDITTLAENRQAVESVSNSVNNRVTLKNNAEAIKYIDDQHDITAGLLAYKDVPGVKEVVGSVDADVRSLVGNEVMLANTRINKEGYLVAATDVQGGLGTLQQYLTGAKYRDSLDKVNTGLSGVPLMHRKNVAKLVLSSYGKTVSDYDPNVDGEMSTEATGGEKFAQDVFETVGAGWEKYLEGVKKFDEKIFIPLQNTFQEGIEKYVTPYIDEVEKALPTVVKDLQGGEGTYRDYLMNNIKESVNKVAEYISTSVASYKALQAGKDAPSLEGVVNKPEEPTQPVDSGDNLSDFLSTIKHYADPSHYEMPEIRLDKIKPNEQPTTILGKAAEHITDDKNVIKTAESIGLIREGVIEHIKEKSSEFIEGTANKGKEVVDDVVDIVDIVGRTAAYNELAPKVGHNKALEIALGDEKDNTTRLEKGWTTLQAILGKGTEKIATKVKDVVIGTAKTIYDYLTEEVSVKDDALFESYFEHLINTKLYDLPKQYEIEYKEDPSKIELFPQVKSIKKNR